MVPSSLTGVFLVAVNLIPLFGVLFLGWGLFPIMVLYWLENGIVGLFNLPKIALASAPVVGLGTGGPASIASCSSTFGDYLRGFLRAAWYEMCCSGAWVEHCRTRWYDRVPCAFDVLDV